MENQHREIKGYRELSEDEIALMNIVKEAAEQVRGVLDLIAPTADPRWLAIAKTDLQKGFMAATRSVAKPEFF